MIRAIPGEHVSEGVFRALQHASMYHPPDFLRALQHAWEQERSEPAKNALRQILRNSRLAAAARRPLCQDTGIVVVFVRIGMRTVIDSDCSLQELIDAGVRRAYTDASNPLRASIVDDPVGARRNTHDNTPAVVHVESVPGCEFTCHVAAKGGGSENKAKLAILNPGADVARWVIDTVGTLGAGWCPPGVLGVGIGGTAEKAAVLAKRALLDPLDMHELQTRAPRDAVERLRREIYDGVNALGIGAQGFGGTITALDVKVRTFPTHAASLPVALIPNCAATRHAEFSLDGSNVPEFLAPPLSAWPELEEGAPEGAVVDLDGIEPGAVRAWKAGDVLRLRGSVLTARDAAHRRLVDLLQRGQALPVELRSRFLYYVGPVDAKPNSDEVIGPAGPTTASRMDAYTEPLLSLGLLGMIGKAERSDATAAAIARHGAVYLAAVGGAAYLISRSIRAARLVAFPDLGMEAIYEFDVVDLPVVVAVDTTGTSVHRAGRERWQRRLPLAAVM